MSQYTHYPLTTGGSASPLTTKGDIYTYSTLDTRLPVGTNGQILSADSGQATGLSWIPVPITAWGTITGTLSNQTDLINTLNTKMYFRGTWGSGTAYVDNDVVTYTDGISYVAIQPGTNKIPPSNSSFWTPLALTNGYTPAQSSNWSPVPSTIPSALDQLATRGIGATPTNVYVDASFGSNSTGNGSILRPYATVVFAMGTITDATITKKYSIMIAPGTYTEGVLTLKPYIFLVGRGLSTVYQSDRIDLDSTWNTQANAVAGGFLNLIVQSFDGATLWDFTSATSNISFSFENSFFTGGSPFIIKGADNFNVAFNVLNTLFNSVVQMDNSVAGTGNITISQYGGSSIGFNVNANGGSGFAILTLASSIMFGTINADGVNANVEFTSDSIPASYAIVLTSGASVFRLNDAWATGYTPTTPSNWSTQPDNVFDALDILAGITTSSIPNTLAGFDGSGHLYTIPDWSVASTRTLSIIASGAGVAGNDATVSSGSSGAGTDLAGGNLNLSSGNSTGTGTSSILFKIPLAAGSTGAGVNTPATAAFFDGDYQFGLNGTGSGTFRQRAATNTTSYSVTWPAAQASGTRILENDGSGNLSWAAAGSAGAAIGSPISGGTPGSVLFVDVSGNLGQDNANFLWDMANARLGLGATAPHGKLHISDGTIPVSAVIASGTLDNGYLNATRNGSNQNNFAATTGNVFRFIRANTDLSSPTALTSGDSIFQMLMRGYDGSSNLSPATLSAVVNGSVSVGSIPMDWVFTTGTSTAVEALRIKSTGVINIAGFASAGLVHNDSSGNLSTSLAVNADISASAAIAYSKLNLATSIVNADISASAAIAYSKLNLATSIINADISASAAIAYSKLNLTSSIVNADISASAAIAYSKLNLATSIVNADISTSAAIAYSKLATMATGSILLGNAGVPTATALSGDVTVGATGVTAIGSGKVTNTMVVSIDASSKLTSAVPVANGGTNITSYTTGDTVYASGSTTLSKLAIGTSSQYLGSTGTAPSWKSFTAPTVQKFTSGSGTYTTAAGVLYIKVQMVGGGGGGAGSALTANHDGGGGGSGGNTTFGTTLLVANGGNGGVGGNGGIGTGGTASLGTGPIGIALTGGSGNGSQISIAGTSLSGGNGGTSGWGGAGASEGGNGSGTAGVTNTGGGGGGAAATNTRNAGAGGGAGGYVDAIITSPSGSYSYAVGAAGNAGAAGTSGNVGFAGGSGMIVIWEYYQ